jgi:uncharacterized repeat protein (TIGR03803 family)
MTLAGTLTGLNPFIIDDEPMEPVGRLVPAADGSVFGVSCRGGWLNAGAIYKRSPSGVMTTIRSFFIVDGACPYTLIRGADGYLYGAALLGGTGARGTIFRVSETGALTVLHAFAGPDGAYPSDLLQTRDGQLWGITAYAGNNYAGGIFRMTTAGAFTPVHTFSEGCQPQLGPQAPDGSIYGTLHSCTDPSAGTLFRMTQAGVVTTLHVFGSATGYRPSWLTAGSDGNLYGTVEAAEGGPGAIFMANLAGEVTTLHTFIPSEGQRPAWGLHQGQDGNFYGVTFGASSTYDDEDPRVGTVFSTTPSGSVTPLHTFSLWVTGGKPFGPVTQTPDGAIFGTTLRGGSGKQGVLFRIVVNAPGGN